MKSLFTISLITLFFVKPVLAQEEGVTPLSNVTLGVDVFGTLLTPMVSNFNNPGKHQVFRPSAEVQLQFSNYFYAALALEYNNIQVNDLENGFTNYTMRGMAFKPSVVFQKREGLFFIGFGLIIGSQTEEGFVHIPSNYFPDYREFKRHRITPTGALLKTGVNVELNQRLSLKFEVNFISIGGVPTSDTRRSDESTEQKIEYFVGSNRLSRYNQSNVSFSARSFCYLNYRF